MFWALVIAIGQPGHQQEFVIDSFTNVGDCVMMLRDVKPRAGAVNLPVEYRCERTRVRRR